MNKDKIILWFRNNFQVHNDWTGSWVEYCQHCGSVEKMIENFLRDIEERE